MLQTGEEQIRLRLLQTLLFAQKKKKKGTQGHATQASEQRKHTHGVCLIIPNNFLGRFNN